MKKNPSKFMPSAAEHQAKVAHNKAFLQSITDPVFCDWMAVAAFYIAVHLVEQVFALTGQHSQDHRGRNKSVRKQLRPIHSHFRSLYNLSMVARYQESSKFNLNAAAVQGTVVGTRLAAIESFVALRLAPPVPPIPPAVPPTSGS
jgi:hypothetical protein